MPNIASVLKSEISRLARKETKAAVNALRRAATSHRSEIAALKRRVAELEQTLRRVAKRPRGDGLRREQDTLQSKNRFSAKGLAAQRKRLGLSAQDVGLLLGTTSQSIYNWEAGKARPRASHMPAIVALRSLGSRQAQSILAQRRPARG
jgi:DNA-binding transcriptional regulator YiaG